MLWPKWQQHGRVRAHDGQAQGRRRSRPAAASIGLDHAQCSALARTAACAGGTHHQRRSCAGGAGACGTGSTRPQDQAQVHAGPAAGPGDGWRGCCQRLCGAGAGGSRGSRQPGGRCACTGCRAASAGPTSSRCGSTSGTISCCCSSICDTAAAAAAAACRAARLAFWRCRGNTTARRGRGRFTKAGPPAASILRLWDHRPCGDSALYLVFDLQMHACSRLKNVCPCLRWW